MEEMEEIICMTAEQWREYEIEIGRLEAKVRQRHREEKRATDRERRMYYLHQKMIGSLIILVSLFLFVFTMEIETLICIVPGIYMIATKKMCIVNEYYRTHGGSEQWSD